MSGRLEGKVAIVTGAAQGMGESHLRALVAQGARVVGTDIAEERGAAIAAELGEAARFVRHDVASLADWERVVTSTEAEFGPVTVLVNNAGILGPAKGLLDLTEQDYLTVVAVNQHSQFYGMKSVVPSMLRAGGGSIVNVSSLGGIMVNQGTPNIAYPTTKFAVRGMTKAVAREVGSRGIRVNSIHPGAILTPMATATLGEDPGSFPPSFLDRYGKPEEVSALVVFLASDDSSYITGAEHVIDAGWSAGVPG